MKVIWICLLLIGCTHAEEILSLDSSTLGWKVYNQNQSIVASARVPGGIYSDLYDSGILSQQIFYRNNDREYRWVALENWTYERTFDVPEEIMNKTAINIVFYGIDTIADIYLNGELLGSSDNMFRRYVFPIKDIVQATNNTLQVRFTSPVTYSAAQYEKNPIHPECVPDEYQGECHVNMIRKMPASFSWDWGPSFPSVGLWKSVEIEGYDFFVLRDFSLTPQYIEDNGEPYWIVNYTIFIDSIDEFEGSYGIALHMFPKNSVQGFESKVHVKAEDNSFTGSGYLTLSATESKDIERWWPNGMGEQRLYTVDVEVTHALDFDDVEESKKTVKIGFRTVELVQEPVGNEEQGLNFYFKVNGVPIFAKGSNWIPADILPEKGADPTTLRYLLESAQEANMNMLRVWGGGVYESDLFYQLADELGILIWQDMMFASSMYPADDTFLESVRHEIENQILRLQYHPSIAIWSGNNENEGALRGNVFDTQSNFEGYKADYVKLYVDTVGDTISKLDPQRPLVYSSPSNGPKTVEEGYVATDPGSSLYGDIHHYNYGADGWVSSNYPDTRFASEYGFQSLPSIISLRAVSIQEDLSISSEFMQRRQHHPDGNNQMKNLIRMRLPLPEEDDTEEYLTAFIYYSQISQAVSTKTETEKYRRDRTKLTDSGLGQTMGALYWQLNDVWQGPSWSSIEYDGRWKMLNYLAKSFFSPVLVTPEVTNDGKINIYLVSDLLEDLPKAQLITYIHSYTDITKDVTSSLTLTLQKATSSLVSNTTVEELLQFGNCSKNECFFHFMLMNGTTTLSHNAYYPTPLKEVNLPKPNIKVDVTFDKNKANLHLTSDAIAHFIWFETDVSGKFSDNGFTFITTERDITFESRDSSIDQELFKSTLTVQCVGSPQKQKLFS